MNSQPTAAQQQALAWLHAHNGSGIWTQDGTLLAAGEVAPVMRMTWNALRDAGLVTFARGTRLAITDAGVVVAKAAPYREPKRYGIEFQR